MLTPHLSTAGAASPCISCGSKRAPKGPVHNQALEPVRLALLGKRIFAERAAQEESHGSFLSGPFWPQT